jgi:hypothetical protein
LVFLEGLGKMTTFKDSRGAKPVMAEFPWDRLAGQPGDQRHRGNLGGASGGRVWRNGENVEKNVNGQNKKQEFAGIPGLGFPGLDRTGRSLIYWAFAATFVAGPLRAAFPFSLKLRFREVIGSFAAALLGAPAEKCVTVQGYFSTPLFSYTCNNFCNFTIGFCMRSLTEAASRYLL